VKFLPLGSAPWRGSTISFVSWRVKVAGWLFTLTLETVKPCRSRLNSVSDWVARAVSVVRPFRTSVAGS
jgi:hypothetical protein